MNQLKVFEAVLMDEFFTEDELNSPIYDSIKDLLKSKIKKYKNENIDLKWKVLSKDISCVATCKDSSFTFTKLHNVMDLFIYKNSISNSRGEDTVVITTVKRYTNSDCFEIEFEVLNGVEPHISNKYKVDKNLENLDIQKDKIKERTLSFF